MPQHPPVRFSSHEKSPFSTSGGMLRAQAGIKYREKL